MKTKVPQKLKTSTKILHITFKKKKKRRQKMSKRERAKMKEKTYRANRDMKYTVDNEW